MDSCQRSRVDTVAEALDAIEAALCSLNPVAIKVAPDCSWLKVKDGRLTPAPAIDILQCLPRTGTGDTIYYDGTAWVIGPLAVSPGEPVEAGVPTVVEVFDTETLNLEVTKTGNTYTIAGVPIVSPISGNILRATPEGLEVIPPAAQPPPPPLGCADLTKLLDPRVAGSCYPVTSESPTTVFSMGQSGLAFRELPSAVAPPPPTIVEVFDTETLNLEVTKAGDTYTIAGVPIVSPVPGNLLRATPDGLEALLDCVALTALISPTSPTTCYPDKTDAPTSILSTGASGLGYRALPSGAAPTIVAVTDTPTLDLAIAQSGNTYTVSGVPVVSPDPGNLLRATGNGLLVTAPPAASLDCVSLTALISPTSPTTCYPDKADAPTSILSTGASGLGYRALPSGAAPTIVAVADTPTLDLSIAQSGNTYTVSGVPVVSPASGNLLQATSTGLLVPEPTKQPLVRVQLRGRPTPALTTVSNTISAISSARTVVPYVDAEGARNQYVDATWDAATNTFTIGHDAWYQFSASVFLRLQVTPANLTNQKAFAVLSGFWFQRPGDPANEWRMGEDTIGAETSNPALGAAGYDVFHSGTLGAFFLTTGSQVRVRAWAAGLNALSSSTPATFTIDSNTGMLFSCVELPGYRL